jgi:hypothetical protein
MKYVIAVTSTVLAFATFLWGFITEYRQSRDQNYNAIVPTLPFAVAASFFISFAVWGFDVGFPFWGYPIIFLGSSLFLGFSILKISKTSDESNSEKNNPE